MYCTNCGKETSNAASFCPYCGAKKVEKIPEVKRQTEAANFSVPYGGKSFLQTANQASGASDYNRDGELPVYKRRNKAAFLVGFLPIIHILSLVFLIFIFMLMFMMSGSGGSGMGAMTIVMLIVMVLVGFPVIFCILGSRTGHKFNTVGFISLIAYLISLFVLPVISNKYEDSLSYQLIEGFANEFGGEFTPTQFEILTNFSGLSEYSDDIGNYFGIMFIMLAGVILFAILLFDMILLRKNTAQMIMGSILSVFAAGMLYLDYRIFHSGSLRGKLVGMALSKTGFSLSPFCLLIMLFAILTIITAYRCSKKEKEST